MKRKSNKQNISKELFDKMVDGITNIINSGEYEKFLKFSKNFKKYSFNNIILIFSQMPDATQVAGFKEWNKMGRTIKPGEKGIQISYPIKRKYIKNKTNSTTDFDSADNVKEEQEVIEYLTYGKTYVYDVSQTVGEPLPLSDNQLNSSNMSEFFNHLFSFSPYPIFEKEIERYC